MKAVEQLIHRSLEKLKDILRNHVATKEALLTLRDTIQQMIEGCADNITIIIYLDEVLDGFIEIKAGQAKNRFRVTIKSNGEITNNWTELNIIEEFQVEAGVRSICENLLCVVLELLLSFLSSYVNKIDN